MLNEKQIKGAKLYAEGATPTEISRELGVSRQAFYGWLKNKEFTSEVDRFIQEIVTSAEKNMNSKVENYIHALEDIAFTGRSEKNRTDALTYLLDRVLGKATTRVQDVTEDKEDGKKEISWDNIEEDNILELKKKKSS
ncbi:MULTISPECIES: phBC6A51 family helix-turn-helix protein [Clostridia]|uniref:phBC6A51 family helix-turn-helix protein n=1 Tax=Clostridia TaxID=186801 RepID=UPI002A8EB79E|nr:phBC6A51 family helix-turn-helix protein [Peptostreptococcus porci]MDY5098772.1 phBC6A51 family helix-turn-helix protein [Clostridium sp.]MDY5437437.1 phBC6A51 family helix-turn-helix protein [Peptostreptococcus porci]